MGEKIILLNGNDLTVEDIVYIGVGDKKVELAEDALERSRASRAFLEEEVAKSSKESAEDEDVQELEEEEIPIEIVENQDADPDEEPTVEPAANDEAEAANEEDLSQ